MDGGAAVDGRRRGRPGSGADGRRRRVTLGLAVGIFYSGSCAPEQNKQKAAPALISAKSDPVQVDLHEG